MSDINNPRRRHVVAALAALPFVTKPAWGGGGVTGTGNQDCFFFGPIDMFGSIYVGGTRFRTEWADISVRGAPASELNLRLGMMVLVEGYLIGNGDQGLAWNVDYDDSLLGAISSAPVSSNGTTSFRVLGKTVRVNAGTYLGGVATATSLAVGDVVAVSGHNDFAGNATIATRLERLARSPGYIVTEGRVTNPTTTTFNIGTSVVQYAAPGTNAVVRYPAGTLVHVVGAPPTAAGVIIARSVEIIETYRASAGTTCLSGTCESRDADGFWLGDKKVVIGRQTKYSGGITEHTLANGRVLTVRGNFANGRLNAKSISD